MRKKRKTSPEQDKPQSVTAHLEELRTRLIKGLVTIGLFSVIAYGYSGPMIDLLASHAGGLVFLKPAEAFIVRIKISVYAGLFVSFPILLYQVWRFVSLGLTPGERQVVMRFLPLSYALFLAGGALAWFVIVPMAVSFLISFGTQTLKPFISVDAYLTFVGWMVAAFGGMFQMPIVVFVLSILNIVDAKQLASYRRHVFVGILIMSALATPPDVVSQIVLSFPTYLLYELSVRLVKAREAGLASLKSTIK